MQTIEEPHTTAAGHHDVAFDPARHLAFEPPKERLTMSQLGLGDTPAPSGVAVTSPFSLASPTGVRELRASLLQPKCIAKHLVWNDLNGPHAQLRGMAPHTAKFIYDFWTHPETMRALCEAANEELIPFYDYEIGSTNFQVPAGKERGQYIKSLSADPLANAGHAGAGNAQSSASSEDTDDAPPVVGFHRDAYPWVCVLMLSDVSGMKGGETALRMGSGELFKARGPALGSAVMMQGGYITHAALPAQAVPGASSERITMVTAFRKRDAFGWKDISNLGNIRTASNWNEIYAQWVVSRLEGIQEKAAGFQRVLEARRRYVQQRYNDGFLQAPIITHDEVLRFKEELDEHLQRALDEMKPYGDPTDLWTPRLPGVNSNASL